VMVFGRRPSRGHHGPCQTLRAGVRKPPHKHVTHNRCYATYNDFCNSVLHFLREEVSKNWAAFCDSVTDSFRVINPANFRVLKA